MSFSVYEIIVPVMKQGLSVLDDYLDHAQKWEGKNDLDAGSVLHVRLAPDMLTFGEQFSVTCDKVEVHVAKLCQKGPPELREVTMTYPGLKNRLVSVRAVLEQIDPGELANAQTHTYELKPPIVHGWYGGDDYIRHLVLPDFFFHIAIAHAILRHLGAPVGKRDYLGNLTQESGGYS
jgi:hypothetical protein